MMKILLLPAFAITLSLSAPGAQAQLLDQLKSATGSGSSGSGGGMLGNLGGGGTPSVNQASPMNIAGLLQYCVKNNYLSGGSAASVKDSLVNKVTGSGKNTSDSGFQAGSAGMLESGNGQSVSLGGGGIKEQITRKVCDQVLQHGKSLL
jgi:hypothetical protein